MIDQQNLILYQATAILTTFKIASDSHFLCALAVSTPEVSIWQVRISTRRTLLTFVPSGPSLTLFNRGIHLAVSTSVKLITASGW